jgi:Threonyl-tRNA synthetase
MLVIGKEEKKANEVAVRHRLRGMIGKINLDEFITIIKQEVTEKKDINKEVPH